MRPKKFNDALGSADPLQRIEVNRLSLVVEAHQIHEIQQRRFAAVREHMTIDIDPQSVVKWQGPVI